MGANGEKVEVASLAVQLGHLQGEKKKNPAWVVVTFSFRISGDSQQIRTDEWNPGQS